MTSRPVRVTAVLVLALLSVPMLASCSSLQLAFGSTTSAAYSDVEGFRNDTTLAAPSWVPDDATDIRYTTDRADDSSILTYRSTTHFASGVCDEEAQTSSSEDTSVAGIPLEDSWWPESLPSTLFACGEDWTAFVDGDTVYGFTGGAVDPSATRPASADLPSLP